MDTCVLEVAADIVFRMCQAHPEICPHNYEWVMTRQTDEGEERHYRCRICGKDQIENVPVDFIESKEKPRG